MQLTYLQKKQLSHYPSASAIHFFKDTFYITGDDAQHILLLNEHLETLDTIPLFDSETARIPKKEKVDIESNLLLNIDEVPHLLLMGSGSKERREKAVLINLQTREKQVLSTSKFLENITAAGIEEINIEGASTMADAVILSNRGNKKRPSNYLIITQKSFLALQAQASVELVKVELPTTVFLGISDIQYLAEKDELYFTASIEHTDNSYDDGAIGDSYVGYISKFSQAINSPIIQPTALINLSTISPELVQHKIEGIAVAPAQKGNHLYLISDNDDGQSTVFKLLAE